MPEQKEKWMSGKVSGWAWEVLGLTTNERIVLLALADRSDPHGLCYPGHEDIVKRTGLGRRTVVRICQRLQEYKLVKVSRRLKSDGTRNSNLYQLDLSATVAHGELSAIGDKLSAIEGGAKCQAMAQKPSGTVSIREPSDIDSLPDWLDPKTWADFKAHRKALKAKLTKLAEDRILNRLSTFQETGHDPNAILDESIMQGWKGVFEPKAGNSDKDNEYLERLIAGEMH